MKSRPIIFLPSLIRPIWEGRKTQTRRVIKKIAINCPYGQAGDQLWIKEAWKIYILGNLWRDKIFHKPHPNYQAIIKYKANNDDIDYKWRSPLFMPKWAARIFLTIIDISAEKLRNITFEETIAEGVTEADENSIHKFMGFQSSCPIEAFSLGWDLINAKRGYSWESNPWVWKITFCMAHKTHDV